MGLGNGFKEIRPGPPLGWSNREALRGDESNGILRGVHRGLLWAKRLLSVRKCRIEVLRSASLFPYAGNLGRATEAIGGKTPCLFAAVLAMTVSSSAPE